MALFPADKIGGETEAKIIQLKIEYDPHPLYDSGNYLKTDPEKIKRAEKNERRCAKKYRINRLNKIRADHHEIKNSGNKQ